MKHRTRQLFILQQFLRKVKLSLSLSLSRVKKPTRRQPAFTLVELLIVIVVIAILAAITIISYNGITAKAHTTALQSTLSQNATLLSAYNAENGNYPDDQSSAGLKTSDGVTLTYTQSGGGYCLQAAGWTQTYKITDDNTSPASGGCTPVTGNFPSDLNLISLPSGFDNYGQSSTFTTLYKITAKQNIKLTGIRMYAHDTSELTGYVLTGDASTRTIVATSNTIGAMTSGSWNTVTFPTAYSLTAGQSVWVGAQIVSGGTAAYWYDAGENFFSTQHVQNDYIDVPQSTSAANYTWGEGLTSDGTTWSGWNAVDVTWSSN